jgi:hypothetical protein
MAAKLLFLPEVFGLKPYKNLVFAPYGSFCYAKVRLPFGGNRANVTAFYPNKVQGEWQPNFCFYLRFSGSFFYFV